ncbi:Purine nucleoside phosphorylase deoD-type [Serratia plymuthica]|uniref:nucleoside phosphorylase n=1 Tax=Serratia TaxID=613 RepID=UPI002177A8DB|nr:MULTISPECIES: nucleoside phosphorylase [Serratia]CAI1215092.1 Purine nucleoside phosphorylase deoD-type [Serratia plymuthica]CAI2518573.1 Purine nucleoside phosphorylase deoD-type [Serratia liquefaciens]
MQDNPIVDPKKFISYLRSCGYLKIDRPPSTVILVFLESLLNQCKDIYELRKVDGFDAGELYLLADNSDVGIFYCRGIGAPVAVINMEELIAFGVKNFIVLGTAGALSPKLSIADIILCDSALMDEGTSKHYQPDGQVAYPTTVLHNKVRSWLGNMLPALTEGRTWTTDAPYRETENKVKKLQQQGVLCVEMEASALFTVADFNQVNITSVFVISDSLADLTWTPGFFSNKVMEELIRLMKHLVNFSNDTRGRP